MNKSFYIVNAFTTDTFGGNPAAVCPLDSWLPDDVMQAIAQQHNLSETAFFVPSGKEGVDFEIRWFTPTLEVDLCGHATLATSFVIFNQLNFTKSNIVFDCQVGKLNIEQFADGKISMNFPKNTPEPHGVMATFGSLCGVRPVEIYTANNAQPDLVLVMESEQQVRDAQPNFQAMKSLPQYRCIIPTAPSEQAGVDFVCRVFGPNVGIDEDPVTGSAYTLLAPLWAEKLGADKLGKTDLTAKQLSARGGDVWCAVDGERVTVSGYGTLYAQGELFL